MKQATQHTVEKGPVLCRIFSVYGSLITNDNGILNKVFLLLEQDQEVPVLLQLQSDKRKVFCSSFRLT